MEDKLTALDNYDPKLLPADTTDSSAMEIEDPVSIMPTIISIRLAEKQELLMAISHVSRCDVLLVAKCI
jgi:hypothetical protein